MSHEAAQAREFLLRMEQEAEKLKQQAESAVSEAVRDAVLKQLHRTNAWLDDNFDLYEQCDDRLRREIRGALQRMCAKVELMTVGKIDSTTGVRRRKEIEKEQTLEKWLYFTQKGEPFGHRELAEQFGNTMNDGKPVQRSFYMKQLEELIHNGFVKDITEGGSKTATQVFQYRDFTDEERKTISDHSDWPITKPDVREEEEEGR